MIWAKDMLKNFRYKHIDRTVGKRIFAGLLVAVLLTGCAGDSSDRSGSKGNRSESASDSLVDLPKLREENSDIFAWLYLPGTEIDCPVVQSSEGDDSFYKSHNAYGDEDPKGAVYTESANLKNMCDFNEVLHGSSAEGAEFQDLEKFLDRTYFEDHDYIYVYIEGNALIYSIFAAYTRENTRLIQQYDFTYASGCQEFLDEIFNTRGMNKNIKEEWDNAVFPENFIITLSTIDPKNPQNQIIVTGVLVGDVRGTIDRYVDYSDPEDEY